MASRHIHEDSVMSDTNLYSNRHLWTSGRLLQTPNNDVSENNQVVSTEGESGYSFTGFLAAVVGLVFIAFIKYPWSIYIGTFLAFAGLLSPFYRCRLRGFTQRFRLGVKQGWGYSVQARPTPILRLLSEETAQEGTPIVQDLTRPEEVVHQELEWHAHAQVSLDYHHCKTSPLLADGRRK
jgi:hypothetical protein